MQPRRKRRLGKGTVVADAHAMNRIVGFYFDLQALSFAQLKAVFPDLECLDSVRSPQAKPLVSVRAFLFNYTAASSQNGAALEEIGQLRRSYPQVPVIVTSETLDARAMLSAFRYARIWDYAIIPDEIEFLIGRVHDAFALTATPVARTISFPPSSSLPPFYSRFVRSVNSPGRDLVRKALTYIEANYARCLSVKDVARHCSLTVDTFSRQFTAVHGMSFREYLKRVRLTSARRLLKETQWSIERVAFEVGYEDASLFSRLYRKTYRVSPSQDRAS